MSPLRPAARPADHVLVRTPRRGSGRRRRARPRWRWCAPARRRGRPRCARRRTPPPAAPCPPRAVPPGPCRGRPPPRPAPPRGGSAPAPGPPRRRRDPPASRPATRGSGGGAPSPRAAAAGLARERRISTLAQGFAPGPVARSAGSTTGSASSIDASSSSCAGAKAAWAGAAPPEEEDLAHLALAELLQRVGGHVGARQLGRRAQEDAGRVEGDVAVPHHRHPPDRQVEPRRAVVGVPVVPAHEDRRRRAAPDALPRDAEPAVGLVAGGVDDLVVVPAQLLHREVASEAHVAEEAEGGAGRRGGEDAGDGLDLLVVGRDAAAHEAVGRGQAVEHVDVDRLVGAPEERLGGVEAGRPGTDDGDAHGGPSSRVVGCPAGT